MHFDAATIDAIGKLITGVGVFLSAVYGLLNRQRLYDFWFKPRIELIHERDLALRERDKAMALAAIEQRAADAWKSAYEANVAAASRWLELEGHWEQLTEILAHKEGGSLPPRTPPHSLSSSAEGSTGHDS